MALRESLLLHLTALHDMEEELAAPDGARLSDEEHEGDADEEPRKKKPRGNKIEQKTRAIEEHAKKLSLEQEKVRVLEAKRGTSKRDVNALSSARAKVDKLERNRLRCCLRCCPDHVMARVSMHAPPKRLGCRWRRCAAVPLPPPPPRLHLHVRPHLLLPVARRRPRRRCPRLMSSCGGCSSSPPWQPTRS